MQVRESRAIQPIEFQQSAAERAAITADFIKRRREASRRRHSQEWRVFTFNAVALALAIGIAVGITATCSFLVKVQAKQDVPATVATGAWSADTLPDYGADYGAPESGETLPRATATDAETPKLLEDVPLSADTQRAIYETAGRNPLLFGALIAIADRESDFTCSATGDGGRSRGMFQINTAANRSRLAYYGYTPDDMEDPVRGATIAADILKDLVANYGFGGLDGNSVYMAYNMGPGAAARAIRKGIHSTEYSRDVLQNTLAYATAVAGQE